MKKILLTLAAAIAFTQASVSEAKNKQDAGLVIGGVVGAVVGNSIGDGNAAATGIGAIAGALIGSSIGKDMDDRDRREMMDCQRRALERGDRHRDYDWRGRNHHGRFVVVRNGYYHQQECRSYRSEVYSYSGYREVRAGTTCYGPNGWYEVHERYVSWY